jgi:hypothetical protein
MINGTRRGWGVSVTHRPLFTPGKDPVPTVQEAGWAPGPVWTGAEKLSLTWIRSPDRPARNQSLYRLRYRAHYHTSVTFKWYIYWASRCGCYGFENALVIGIFDLTFSLRMIPINFILNHPFPPPSKRPAVSNLAQKGQYFPVFLVTKTLLWKTHRI